MNPLRKLASQTVVYGLSSIVGRFLNYLLVPLYTYTFSSASYGVVSEFYAYAGFFAVVMTLGLETGYFRFRNRKDIQEGSVYGAALGILILFNLALMLLVVWLRQPIANVLHYADHTEYVLWFGLIMVLDAASALPFARLRAENRAMRFAGIKLTEIAVTIVLNLLFLVGWPRLAAALPGLAISQWYDPGLGVGYIFLANLMASGIKIVLLAPQFHGFRFWPVWSILRPLLGYSLPMVIIGFAGMINEMLDRAILKYLLPYDLKTNLGLLGIYGACYKLSMLMTLFVQAFRYAGEPFFFAYAGRADSKGIYALVMRYFVIFCVLIFLVVTLFMDFFQYFIGQEYRAGLGVAPILLMANLFLGIYVNLSIWYKLTDRTMLGAGVSMLGALLTILMNIWLIPLMGYVGSAWATLACYATMTLVSYGLGQRFYPVDYPVARIMAYLLFGLALYGIDREFVQSCGWSAWKTGAALLGVYLLVVTLADLRPLLRRQVLVTHDPDFMR